MSLVEEYQELRQICIDNMLAEALEEIDSATDHFLLVRANSKWRAVTWYIERRVHQQYGGHRLSINLGEGSVPTEEAFGKDSRALLAHLMKAE